MLFLIHMYLEFGAGGFVWLRWFYWGQRPGSTPQFLTTLFSLFWRLSLERRSETFCGPADVRHMIKSNFGIFLLFQFHFLDLALREWRPSRAERACIVEHASCYFSLGSLLWTLILQHWLLLAVIETVNIGWLPWGVSARLICYELINGVSFDNSTGSFISFAQRLEELIFFTWF